MAPFVPLLAGAQVIIQMTLGGSLVSNRLWFTFDDPPFTGGDLQGLANGVEAWWRTNILPALSHELMMVEIRAKSWIADPPPLVAVNVTSDIGGVAEKSYSANVAVIVPFLWPVDVRLKRNKHFVCGIPDSGIQLNTVQPALQDALFEGYAALVDAARLFVPDQEWTWVATSAWDGGVLRSEQYFADVQGPPLDTPFILGQRRRRLA